MKIKQKEPKYPKWRLFSRLSQPSKSYSDSGYPEGYTRGFKPSHSRDTAPQNRDYIFKKGEFGVLLTNDKKVDRNSQEK
jgi:hypothetical protein